MADLNAVFTTLRPAKDASLAVKFTHALQSTTPADWLQRAVLLGAPDSRPGDPSLFDIARARALTGSLAAWAALGHVLGLGDRHLGNLLLDAERAQVKHRLWAPIFLGCIRDAV